MSNKSFILLLVALFMVASSANAADLITSVCSTTLNPRLCNDVLRADPRSPKADAKGLAFISLDIASSNAKQVVNLVASLLKSANNTIPKEPLTSCKDTIQESVNSLDDARNALNIGDIGTFMIAASTALDGPSTCNEGLQELGQSVKLRQLVAEDKKLQDLCGIVLAAGKRLGG